MAVNTTEITNVYNSLFTAMIAKYDAMWSDNEIDAETYAKLVGQASSQLVQLSADLVQKQESLEKDIDLKQAQIDIAAEELLLKKTEVVAGRASAEAELEKQWGYEVTRDPSTDEIILGASTGTGKIDEEVDLLQTQDLNTLEQIKAVYADRVLKDKQAAKLGLDNVMKISESERINNPNYVYIPSYEETP